MAKSFLNDQKRVLPAASWCDGEYGVNGMYVGVPTLIGAGGTEKVIEFDFNDAEQAMFTASVAEVQKLIDDCKGMEPSLA